MSEHASKAAQLIIEQCFPEKPDASGYSYDSNKASEIIQQAISASTTELVSRLPTPIEWQAIWDALAFTAYNSGCVSDAHNRVVDKVEALIKWPRET